MKRPKDKGLLEPGPPRGRCVRAGGGGKRGIGWRDTVKSRKKKDGRDKKPTCEADQGGERT